MKNVLINKGKDFVTLENRKNRFCLEILKGSDNFPVWLEMSKDDAIKLADNINDVMKRR